MTQNGLSPHHIEQSGSQNGHHQRKEQVIESLRTLVGRILQLPVGEIDLQTPLLEMGADSLMFTEAVNQIDQTFGVRLSLHQLFGELTTLDAIASYLAEKSPHDAQAPETFSSTDHPDLSNPSVPLPSPENVVPGANPVKDIHPGSGERSTRLTQISQTSLERIMNQQLQAMSQLMAEQLEALKSQARETGINASGKQSGVSSLLQNGQKTSPESPVTEQSVPARGHTSKVAASQPPLDLNPTQQAYFNTFVAQYTQRTQKSRQQAQLSRPVLADSRSAAGFRLTTQKGRHIVLGNFKQAGQSSLRLSTKDMVYPIVAQRYQAANFWDLDGNKYVDLAMGFGVHLFGHNVPFINEAVESQAKLGISVGPQAQLAQEVSQRLCELVGAERATFCQSGTESVMVAVRLARTATGRQKIAVFRNAYHGHSDGVLAQRLENTSDTIPIAQGIDPDAVRNVLVLEYADKSALAEIRDHHAELAAVLVEPVQGLNPALQPRQFLHDLRQLTQDCGIALIFDEIVTGFRIHPGGAQAYFGVQADIATYGKVLVGGLPGAAIAGKSRFMDAIDGGTWDYGDDSYPKALRTFFRGTFNKHALGLAASRAVLKHLQDAGPDLQSELNQRTEQLVNRLNRLCAEHQVPIDVVHFGSLFRFIIKQNPDLFYYHLIHKGVYVWEGRSCFISTAHTDEDIEYVFQAVQESIAELKQAGFLTTLASLRASEALGDSQPSSGSSAVVSLPLTEAQQQLAVLSELSEEGALAYGMSLSLRLKGRLDIDCLNQCLAILYHRHDALRTVIHTDTRTQQIEPSQPVTMALVDFSGLSTDAQAAQLATWYRQDSATPYDLPQGPLFRVYGLKLAEDHHILVLSGHHIVLDGWSIGLLLQELCSLYRSTLQGETPALPPVMQFSEYIQAQTAQSQTESMARSREYWVSQFAHGVPVLELPTDHSRPALKTYGGGRQTQTIAPALYGPLQQLARQQNCTLFMVLLAVYLLLLHRLSGQTEIIVGVPSSGRSMPDSGGMVGYGAHLLPIYSHYRADESFGEYLARVRYTLISAYEHQQYPFAELLSQLQLPPDLSRTPLVSATFNLEAPVQLAPLPELTAELSARPIHYAPYELHCNLIDLGDRLVLDGDYNSDLYEGTTLERWLDHFQTLLRGVVSQPTASISRLPILTAEERHQLLEGWNDTTVDYGPEHCVHRLMEAQVERSPDAVAVVFEAESLTYRQLNERANQLARYLQNQGVKPESRVGICVDRSLEMVVGVLGILKAGGAYVPLDPNYPNERLSHMLQDSGVELLLTQQSLLQSLPSSTVSTICLDTQWPLMSVESTDNVTSAVQADNLLYVIYTSGSTGVPKGIALAHRALTNLIHWHLQTMDVGVGILQFASLSFDASFHEMFAAWCSGGTLFLIPEDHRLDLDKLVHFLAENPIQKAILPVVLWQKLAEVYGDRPLLFSKLTEAIATGEQLQVTPQMIDLFSQLDHCVFHNHYGPSETHVVTSYILPESPAQWSSNPPIGYPIANTQIYLLDSQQQPVPIGVAGELHIGGVSLARGYLNRPKLTNEKFISNPFGPGRLYKTGDLARYLQDGNIEYLGRIDHQVKLRGFRIELGEIEAALSHHPEVNQVVVIAREDQPGDKRLVAYIVNSDTQLEPVDLRQLLKTKLPDYMIPSAFVQLAALPLTPNGKVDRKALPAPDPNLNSIETLVTPQSPSQELIADLFSSILKVHPVGIHQSFFELGGHSLLATQLISRLRQTFELEIPLRILFEAPTIFELDQCVQQLRQENSGLTLPKVTPLPREGQHLPLSWAQERLWFLNQLEEGTAATYNMPAALHLTGSLNVDALEQAFKTLVERHEILRTRFPAVAGLPVQEIVPNQTVAVKREEWFALNSDEWQKHIQRAIQEEARAPFDLAAGPLLRVKLLQHSTEEALLLVTLHHIIADGWSISVLIREVATAYQAVLAGQDLGIAPLPVQYGDYVLWQQLWLQGNVLEQQLAYWRKQLASPPNLLQLPTDYPRPALQSHQGACQDFHFSAQLTQQLEKLSQSSGVTLFMTLLAGFGTLLYRYSGQSDILIGSPIANRNRAEIEPLIGFFTNTLVLRLQLENDLSFAEVLRQVREITLDSYAHQEAPFEQIVEALQPERSLSHAPLFQVMFVFQNTPEEVLELPGLALTSLAPDTLTTKFDLTLSMQLTESGLVGSWEYSTDLFEAKTIARLSGHLQQLLESVVAAPEMSVSRLPLLTPQERNQLLVEWNDTTVEYPHTQCIHQLFETQVKKTPDAVAVTLGSQHLTYRELNQRANQLAHYLKQLGVKPETLVGLYLERSLDMMVGLLGILKAGGAYVPLDPNYPKQRLLYMLQDAAAPVLLTQETLMAGLPSHDSQVVCLGRDESKIAACSTEPVACDVHPDNLAYVIYTSGSTGQPKGVEINHQGLTNYLYWCVTTYFNSKGIGALVHSSIGFDATITGLFSPLLVGQTVFLLSADSDIEALATALQSSERLSLVKLTPAHLKLLAFLLPAEKLAHQTQAFVIGGEALTNDIISPWLTHAPETRLINEYGPTETVVGCCTYDVSPNDHLTTSIPIGRPIANTQLYILDAQLQPVPIGVVGELYIGGDGVARGYRNRPELTAQKFIPNPFGSGRLYKTGDLTRYLVDGKIEFLGRLDHQVKIRGFRIELGEIESILSSHPKVQQVIVIARDDNQADPQLVAYVVSQDNQLTSGELRDFLTGQLPTYMLPSAFVQLETLPLTPNGKVDRKALPVPTFEPNLDGDFMAPRTPTEESIATIFASVLGLDSISIHSSFFELGGHSLLATQAIAKLRDTFQLELPLRELFEAPTVAELDQRIQQALTGQSRRAIAPMTAVPRDADIPLPLSWSQERLWFLEQLDGSNAAYSIPVALKITGQIDIVALESALSGVIARHESLRTTFPMVEGKPIQAIAPISDLSIPIEDLSNSSAEQHPEILQQSINAEAQAPFSLAKGPLLRLRLLRLTPQSNVLLLTLHHAIFDGWSSEILIREFVTLYGAYQQRQISPLVPLVNQYADYAYWQRHVLSDTLDSQLSYWKQHLSGDLPVLRLPTDSTNLKKINNEGARCSCLLSVSLSQKLKALSQRENVTLFMALLAAFNLLLSRQTDQTDIIIGTPIAGRQHPGTTDLIGFFINTLPIRVDLSGITTFQDLLSHVREVTLAAYSNQDVPFEQLVKILQPERSLERHPIFDVMLNLMQPTATALEMEGLEFEMLEMPELESKFWITLYVYEPRDDESTGLTLELVYRRSLFSAERMEIFLDQFKALLEQIVLLPDQPIQNYSLLTPKTKSLLPDPVLPLEEPQFSPITDLIRSWSNQQPEHIAITQAEQSWTYQQLFNYAEHVAENLIKAGVKTGDVVAVYGNRCFELIVHIVGILLSGSVLLTLDPNLPTQRLQLMVQAANVGYLIALDSESPKDWLSASIKLLAGSDIKPVDKRSPQENHSVDDIHRSLPHVHGEQPAYIFFTSGSTGMPKGVMGSHKGIAHFVDWQRETFQVGPGDRVAQLIRLSFDALLRDIFLPLTSGATLCLPPDDEVSSEHLLRWLENEKISVIHTVPTVAQYWISNAPNDVTLSTLRATFFSGEPLTDTLIGQWKQAFPGSGKLINLYGATETTMVKSYYPIPEQVRPGIQSVGWPLPQTQNLVLRAVNQPCGIGEIGEIVVRTPFRTFGYINTSATSNPCFVPNPFRSDQEDLLYYTGDQGRYLPDGSLEVLDRLDGQLKIRGTRVQPGEIESRLHQHPDVGQTVIVGRINPDGNQVLVAYIVPKTPQGIDRDQLNTYLLKQLPAHLIPSVYMELTSLPLTASGKVDRNALPDPEFTIRRPLSVPPRNPTEISLANIMGDILKQDSIDIHDSFFALGGHSLQATQVVARISQTFGLELSLRTFFESPTVAALAQIVADHQQGKKNTESTTSNLIPKRRRRKIQRSADGTLIVPDNLKEELWGKDKP